MSVTHCYGLQCYASAPSPVGLALGAITLINSFYSFAILPYKMQGLQVPALGAAIIGKDEGMGWGKGERDMGYLAG